MKIVHNGMKNSSPSDAQSDDRAALDQGLPATKNASGLTRREGASGGGRAGIAKADSFTVVTRRKRGAALAAQKEGLGDDIDSFPPLASMGPDAEAAHATVPAESFHDPFGLAGTSLDTNPVTVTRRQAARTKQTARKSTARANAEPSQNLADGEQASKSSSDDSSERSRNRRWAKGCRQDKAAAENRKKVTIAADAKPKEHSVKLKRSKAATLSDASSDGWHTDGSAPDSASEPAKASQAAATSGKAKVVLPTTTGRFNGRIHATPLDGSCGPAALLEALRHLAYSRGYQFVIPNNTDALRAAMVQDIAENLAIEGSNEGSPTLEQEIAEEYFPGDLTFEERRGLFNPDLDPEHYIQVDSVEEYLQLMACRHTHIDEFMLSAFARMWGVRVAVIRREGKGVTTEHSQFVPPGDPVPAEWTVFLLRRGNHFEWVHANATPCNDRRCERHSKRISAQHTPWHVPAAAAPCAPQAERPPAKHIPEGARQSRGGESDLAVLVEQLLEEHPGLSPDRAEAALKLTKQNGRYNLYKAAVVLPGQEGAPISIPSESPPSQRSAPSEQNKKDDVYFSSGSESNESSDESEEEQGCKKRGRRAPQSESEPSDGDGHAPSGAKGVPARKSGAQQRRGSAGGSAGQDHHVRGGGGHQQKDAECQFEHDMNKLCSQQDGGATAYHINRCCELNRAVSQGTTARLADEEQRAIRVAAQIISLAAKRTLQEAHEVLQRHVLLHGDLQIAAHHACRELMDGPAIARPAPKINDVPDEGGVSLAERQLGKSARTPTVKMLAKRSKQVETAADGKALEEESLPRPKRLFDRAFSEQMQAVGGGLTAGQRLSTAVRRADGALWRQARDERFPTAPRTFEDDEGNTPSSAALLGNQTMRTSLAAATTAQLQPAAPRAAASHSSPVVRIAEQMRLKREQGANAQGGMGAVVVVNSTGNKLPTWRPGSEAEGKGFNWKTKQKMMHAWEQYQLSEGLHAPKTFKSMIDPDLMPLICAECNLEEGDWEVLDDVTLLSAIEEKLRPHDSMDFTVQLKQVPFEHDEAKGSLTQRYRLFAEAFLAKVSEAKAAGCALQENVVKLAFSRAVSGDAILQGWLEQNKWISAAETHRRITNSLKMVDAYQALAGMGRSARPQQGQQQGQQQQQFGQLSFQQQQAQQQQLQQQQMQQQQMQQQQVQQQQFQQPHRFQQQQPSRQARQQQNFNQQVSSAVNAALAAYQQAALQQQQAAAPPPRQQQTAGGEYQQQAGGAAAVNAMSTQTQMSLPPFPGLDGRGMSWHVHGPLLQCRCIPCTSKFCQACGVHGHTVENCRKRLFRNPGINTSGYWSEQKPTSGPLLMPAPAPPQFAPTPGARATSAFPTPYRIGGGGGAANHVQAQQAPAQEAASAAGASVNHIAHHMGSRMSFQDQQQQPPAGSREGADQ